MNSEQIHDALNYLDEDLILSVEQLRNGSRKIRKQWAAIAACLCLLITGAFAARGFGLFPISQTPPTPTNATPTNATQATPTDAPTTPTGAGVTDGSQGTSQVDETTSPLAPTGILECPSILITISAWENSGFLGEVSGFVDTDSIPMGTTVAVHFTSNISTDVLHGNVLYWTPGAPDADDFPVGSTVCVRFCRSDTHSDNSVTLYAEAVSSVCTTIKDG